jgi:hypothetical protein
VIGARGRAQAALVACLTALLAAVAAADAATAPTCANAALSLVVPRTEGTATQAVAFVELRVRGRACRIGDAVAALTVVRHGARVPSIRGNPVRYRIAGTFEPGTWMLFDVWWANWCGARGGFRARATMGPLSASAPYEVMPYCDSPGSPSSLHGVRAGSGEPPPAGP